MIPKKLNILFTTLMLVFYIFPICAQEETDSISKSNYEPGLALSYLKNTEGKRILTCEIKAKLDKKLLPIENAEISFYAGNDSQLNLGMAKSDKNGIANLEIKPNMQLPFDADGTVKYSAEYKSQENSAGASEEITITDISFEMILEEIDSVRTVSLKATKILNKEQVPFGDFEINIFVKRLYSNLKVGSVFLDKETGEGTMEFPVIPGDSIGNIVVIAKVDADEKYGSVEKNETIKWGTKVQYNYNRIGPALWSSNAPLWMTITLYIFLAGVWYHLILIFRRLYKVKKLGKQTRKDINFL